MGAGRTLGPFLSHGIQLSASGVSWSSHVAERAFRLARNGAESAILSGCPGRLSFAVVPRRGVRSRLFLSGLNPSGWSRIANCSNSMGMLAGAAWAPLLAAGCRSPDVHDLDRQVAGGSK